METKWYIFWYVYLKRKQDKHQFAITLLWNALSKALSIRPNPNYQQHFCRDVNWSWDGFDLI